MANSKKTKAPAADGALDKVTDYRYPESTRKNNPPAKIAAEGYIPLIPKAEYLYSPRRPPELRFDPTGSADELPELLATARQRKLTEAEAWALAEALRIHEPWLEWAGKRETKSFAVDPVALHIHERVSTQAILRVAAREDVYRSLFADPEQEYNEAVQFYKHDVDWSNRLILGDSLQVMSSLARREDLAGKVQMIYIDPPYGIKFASNFQPEIGKRDVKEKEADLTREPEMVKAYRDTWALGVHSYLAYLRDRLIVAKELLADTGSVFVQIGDENVHHVREVMDDVFGAQNCISVIVVQKTTSASGEGISTVADFLLWYARNRESAKTRPLYLERSGSGWVNYDYALSADGTYRRLGADERANYSDVAEDFHVYRRDVIPTLSADRKHLLWLDYDDVLQKSHIADLVLAGTYLSPGSMVLVTVDVQPPGGEDDGPREWKQHFEDQAGNYLGPYTQLESFVESNLLAINTHILKGALASGLVAREARFLPLFWFVYQDGHRMLTLGGMIATDAEARKVEGSTLQDAAYYRGGSSTEPYSIRVPNLTRRERMYLDREMPCADTWSTDEFELDPESVRDYREVYRYLPAYAELLL